MGLAEQTNSPGRGYSTLPSLEYRPACHWLLPTFATDNAVCGVPVSILSSSNTF